MADDIAFGSPGAFAGQLFHHHPPVLASAAPVHRFDHQRCRQRGEEIGQFPPRPSCASIQSCSATRISRWIQLGSAADPVFPAAG
ncbi:hypothetical protein DY245_43175 [Streptomyces inhibens]|uniref:Uncharacterized protein n=1 Tax=Streptomyces inhibens TaxID=2293571 RepID=A0A371PPK5_STRIH|nr:hypothetical protein [Streptomyces inhibens]REK84458.1 hypothetical protein DY245_43175 [Streptomyces inhibens]